MGRFRSAFSHPAFESARDHHAISLAKSDIALNEAQADDAGMLESARRMRETTATQRITKMEESVCESHIHPHGDSLHH